MKANTIRRTLWLFAAAFFLPVLISAQKAPAKRPEQLKPVIFAVVSGGKLIEPIGAVAGGKLVSATDESDDAKSFSTRYYKPRTSYSLIFGGAQEGLAGVVKSNVGTECGGASADVTVTSAKAKLVAPIFALATNLKLKPDVKSYRRRPTPAERASLETLVRAEYIKKGASQAAVKTLRYHNLTAVDIDGDGEAEFIGSYWIAPTKDERRLLFFVTGRVDAALTFAYSEHSVVTPDDVMTGDLKDVDEGRGAELLVDVLDYDADGVKEIFTIGQAFEGNNYYVYRREGTKWTRVYETYIYRCAF
jgi:hypothetical protein